MILFIWVWEKVDAIKEDTKPTPNVDFVNGKLEIAQQIKK